MGLRLCDSFSHSVFIFQTIILFVDFHLFQFINAMVTDAFVIVLCEIGSLLTYLTRSKQALPPFWRSIRVGPTPALAPSLPALFAGSGGAREWRDRGVGFDLAFGDLVCFSV